RAHAERSRRGRRLSRDRRSVAYLSARRECQDSRLVSEVTSWNITAAGTPMTSLPTPQPFDPDRYRTASAHYERGRPPYAPALIRRVAEVTGLGSQHRVLDLGC